MSERYLRVYVGENKVRREHVIVAERAFGRRLPPGCVVHHVDEDPHNNEPSNLVICRRAYHNLIHQRMRALAACGNASWRLCMFCGRYDDPAHMAVRATSAHHRSCRQERRRARRKK